MEREVKAVFEASLGKEEADIVTKGITPATTNTVQSSGSGRSDVQQVNADEFLRGISKIGDIPEYGGYRYNTIRNPKQTDKQYLDKKFIDELFLSSLKYTSKNLDVPAPC